MWTNTGTLYVGNAGSGTLTVEAGGQVSSTGGYLSYSAAATFTGQGSKWTNSSSLSVGYNGSGVLTIEAGGQVSNTTGSLGYSSGSTSTVTVTGSGSMWNNSSSLSVGYSSYGIGALNIRGDGNVTANSVSINTPSLVTLDVGHGSLLRVGGGTGTITNSGKVRIVAGPQPTAGSQYAPIAAATWSGSGTYQALGGTWDATSHRFTVSPTLGGVSGTPVAIDLAQTQRVSITESAGRGTAVASFLAKTGTGQTFDLTASTLTVADLTALQGLLTPGQTVLSGWNFSAAGSGYVATDPIYLSFGIPANLSRGDLHLWRLNGGTWSSYTAGDLTSIDGYASFTVTGVSGYAVAAAVPEPTVLVLLIASACGVMLGRSRRIALELISKK